MRRALALIGCLALSGPAAAQELRGHGGPVRAIAVSPDGLTAVSGSFDQRLILWRLDQGAALAVLRHHDGAVNAVAFLPDGRFVSGGEEGRVALWRPGADAPEAVLTRHGARVAGLAVSADGETIASASWDGTVRLTRWRSGETRTLAGHQGPVNAVAFLTGGAVASVGHDATLRIWPADASPPTVTRWPAVSNALVAVSGFGLALAGADGTLRLVDAEGQLTRDIAIAETPLVALAASRDGSRLAAGGLRGQVAIVDVTKGAVTSTLVGPGLPVWSLAFSADGAEVLSGGADRLVRRWNARTGEHIGPVLARAERDPLAEIAAAGPPERGAQVFRACAACHTLTPDDGARAGPTLHGVFGRRIATAPGYAYSPALRALDIVWSRDTIARLFEIGPNAYTPGTTMPEQIIINPADRQALVEWLERVTR
jgi:cytochrome c